jgi:hypothetical protein
MSPSDEQLLRDITGALTKAIVVVVRSIEAQLVGSLQRQTIIAELKSAAQKIPADSSNYQTTKAILENIAVSLEDGNHQPRRLPLGKGQT